MAQSISSAHVARVGGSEGDPTAPEVGLGFIYGFWKEGWCLKPGNNTPQGNRHPSVLLLWEDPVALL